MSEQKARTSNPTIDPISYNAGIEAAAKWHDEQAELAINSLHCGDSTQTIAAHHRRCQWHRDAAKSLRSLHRTEPQTAPDAPAVTIKPMKLSDGRTDFFVSIRVCGREVTPHVYREEYKAAYHVALYNWLLNGGEKPDLMAFNPGDFPAQPVADTAPADAERLALAEELEQIPIDLCWTEDRGSHRNLTIGENAHKAAKLLRAGGWRDDIENAPRCVEHEERGIYKSDDGSLFYFKPTHWRPSAPHTDKEG